MTRTSRRNEILELATRTGEVSVTELAARFGVSVMTVRRDLSRLASAGRLSRTHGGAVAPVRAGVIEFPFDPKVNGRTAAKQAIAREVAAMLSAGMAVSLDTGTTTLEVARALSRHAGPLTVLTTSLAIASALQRCESIELVLLGGTVRKYSPDLTGPLTEDNLKRFRVHFAILGADAVTPDGLFTTDVNVSRVSRAMIESAEKVVLTVDSTKFMKTAFVRCAPLSDVDRIVTDEECPADVRAKIEPLVGGVTYAALEQG